MMSFTDVIVASLAVWRLAHMFKFEAGPWDIFIRIREKLGDSMAGKAMDCVACMSIWFAIIIFVPGTKYLALLLAISGLAVFLETGYALLRKEDRTLEVPADQSGGLLPGKPAYIYREGTHVPKGI